MYDDYDAIRKQAEERVKKREEAKEGLLGFLIIDGLLWAAWLIAMITGVLEGSATRIVIPLLIITVIWGLSAVGTWYEDVYAADEREEKFKQQVEEEIQRELERRALKEKHKRLMLSDDGELVAMDDEIFHDETGPADQQSR